MDKGQTYEVMDIKLAEQGILNIEIAEARMSSLMKVKSDFESSKEDVDLSQEIISLRKELEKAQIEIASVKSLANERISYLS